MSYSTLMVHLDLDQSNEARLQMAGELAELRVTRSSGDARLDRLVVNSLRGLRVKIPPAAAGTRDRSFEITYDYQK